MNLIDNKSAFSRTTGIGSLPHHNIDSAIDFSFRFGIPFCPQTPIRNEKEYMLPQALGGIPGVETHSPGEIHLNLQSWQKNSAEFSKRLSEVFEGPQTLERFEFFTPKADRLSCWQPFLFELKEKNAKVAKVQITGPLTAQWFLKADSTSEIQSEVSQQIYRFILAQALAQILELRAQSVEPIIFLDEPGLYLLSLKTPHHLVAIKELELFIRLLQKSGAKVGLHCCSNTDWGLLFSLGLDIISLDTHLSLEKALQTQNTKAAAQFIQSGGRFCLGVIPTDPATSFSLLDPKVLYQELQKQLQHYLKPHSIDTQSVLQNSWFSPACGLAQHTIQSTETILELLNNFAITVDKNVNN